MSGLCEASKTKEGLELPRIEKFQNNLSMRILHVDDPQKGPAEISEPFVFVD